MRVFLAVVATVVSVAVGVSGRQPSPAQGERVTIKVDAGKPVGPMKPIWAWFGYDEPNYTYMKDGQKLLTELSKLSPVPVFVRTHNLLTTGDGSPALKWGSTNAYTEDQDGKPIYDWTIVDRIVDTYLARGMKPLMQIGFMPEAMSVKPQPYRHQLEARRAVQHHLHRLGASAEGLREVGRARLPVGAALGEEVRQGGSRELVVGSLERARHRLLARNA